MLTGEFIVVPVLYGAQCESCPSGFSMAAATPKLTLTAKTAAVATPPFSFGNTSIVTPGGATGLGIAAPTTTGFGTTPSAGLGTGAVLNFILKFYAVYAVQADFRSIVFDNEKDTNDCGQSAKEKGFLEADCYACEIGVMFGYLLQSGAL